MAHGGGGRIMHRLIEETVASPLGLSPEHDLNDAAVLALDKHPGRLAFTTDSYVVRPLFFPGGDIGSLSVHGTVNDLAMMGAQPLFLSLGFILE